MVFCLQTSFLNIDSIIVTTMSGQILAMTFEAYLPTQFTLHMTFFYALTPFT